MSEPHFVYMAVILLATVSCVFVTVADKAEIVPSRVLVFIGETFKVYCTLLTSEFSSVKIYFRINYYQHKAFFVYHVVVVNATTAYAEIEIKETNHLEYSEYECMVGNESLRLVAIDVDYPPQEISNFRGVYYYRDKSIVTWDLGVDYFLPDKMEFKIDWNPNMIPGQRANECDKWTHTSCTIGFFGPNLLYIRVNITAISPRPDPKFLKNEYPVSAVCTNKFFLHPNMQTRPPSEFEVLNKARHCFNLTWREPQYFYHAYQQDAIYWIQVKRRNDNHLEMDLKDKVRPFSMREDPIELCNLTSYTEYRLTLQVRVSLTNPWSDPVELTERTMEDIPDEGPPLCSTSYHTEDCYNNKRRTFVYWNDPDPISLNGVLKEFVVEIVPNYTTFHLRHGTNFFERVLECNVSYNISIFSVTIVGETESPSRIHIPREKEALQVPANFLFKVREVFDSDISLIKKNVTISWNSDKIEEENVTLILYMCQEGYKYFGASCFNNFKIVEVDVRENEIALIDINLYEDLFGYALESDKGKKRGIEWTDCIFRPELKPKKVKDVKINAGINSVMVTWNAPRCNKEDKILVLEYHVTVCKEPLLVETSNEYCSKYVIKSETGTELDLMDQDGQVYVYVQSVSYAGAGPLSDPVVANVVLKKVQTAPKAHMVSAVVAIFFGVFVLGVLVFGISSVYIKCKQTKKHFEGLVEVGSERIVGCNNPAYITDTDISEQHPAVDSPPAPISLSTCLHNPGKECLPCKSEKAHYLSPAGIPSGSDFQDPVVTTCEEGCSKNNDSNATDYLKITNTKFSSSVSSTSTNKAKYSHIECTSLSEVTVNNVSAHQMLPNSLQTGNLAASQMSVDEGSGSPTTESTEPELKRRMDIHNCQIQAILVDSVLFTKFPPKSPPQVPQVLSVMDDLHSKREEVSGIPPSSFTCHDMSCKDSNQNEFSINISPPPQIAVLNICSNIMKEENPQRDLLPKAEFLEPQQSHPDFSSNSINKPLVDYTKSGVDLEDQPCSG